MTEPKVTMVNINGKEVPVRGLMDKEVGRQLLLEVTDILDDLGVPHFLCQGTALGAYRDNGFTPSERDIDIGFLVEQFTPRSSDINKALIKAGFETRLVLPPFGVVWVINAIKHGIKTDLVSYLRWTEESGRQTRFCSSNLTEYSEVHTASLLETYEQVTVFGKTFNVPSPIEQYLVEAYGNTWKTPKVGHVSEARVIKYRRKQRMPIDVVKHSFET